MFESKYLPKPPNYGFVNPDFTLPIRTVQPRPIQLHDVDWLDGLMRQAAPTFEMPDVVRVHWGAGDPNVIGALYRVLRGDEDPGLIGVSRETATHYLTKWGYPLDPSAETSEWFESKLAEYGMQPNPMAVLGG